MLSRIKQKFIHKKQQVKVFNYTSDIRPLDQEEQQKSHPLPLTSWSRGCLELRRKNSLKVKEASPIEALDLPVPLTQPATPQPEIQQQEKQEKREQQLRQQQQEQQQKPQQQQPQQPQQQQREKKEKTKSTVEQRDASQMSSKEVEERQRQEQAAQWIESSMRRKSTLPIYPSLERYEIIKKLGDGAFSNVYRARDKRTGRNVAIKVAQKHADDGSMIDLQHLHPNMKKKPRVTERANILKEVQIMRNIHHPNIVQLIQFSESKENYFLVLELCEGGELFHRIVDLTYFSEDLSRHIISQLAQAIYHLHEECGVVHRDIKPENILFEPGPFIPSPQRKLHAFDDASKKDEGLFTKDVGGGGIGQVKLADFGLSKIIWNKDTNTPCGTVGYTAPEIVCDQTYSKGVDMWAIGCVLYTMLCGFPPFYDESITALTRKVAQGQFSFLSPWWDPISDDAKDLIRGLLCVDPRRRYTVRQVLQHPWLTGRPLDSTPLLGLGRSSLDDTESVRMQAMRNAAASSALKSTGIPHTAPLSLVLPTDVDRQAANEKHVSSTTISDFNDTPSSTGRKDIFSSGMTTLKEIFDVTAAVQRMAEEHNHYGDTMRDDDDILTKDGNGHHDDDHHHRQYVNRQHDITQVKKQYNAQATAHHQQRLAKITKSAATPSVMATGSIPIATTKGDRRRQPGFDLDMNNATLLKNRRIKQHLVTPCQ